MAIIVDKLKKRQDIAKSCKELLIKEGFSHLTVSKIAQTAGISKGSFYDYFENKEDLVFEVVSQLLESYNQKLQKEIAKKKSAKEKIKALTAFFYEKEYEDLRVIYAQFAAISLLEKNDAIALFQQKNHDFYRKWVEEIFYEGIEKKEIKKEALSLIDGMFAALKGFFISFKVMQKEDELEVEINRFLESLFSIIEVK
jgi:AcrR family transcriptional regulator